MEQAGNMECKYQFFKDIRKIRLSRDFSASKSGKKSWASKNGSHEDLYWRYWKFETIIKELRGFTIKDPELTIREATRSLQKHQRHKLHNEGRVKGLQQQPSGHAILWRHRFFVGFTSRYRLITY